MQDRLDELGAVDRVVQGIVEALTSAIVLRIVIAFGIIATVAIIFGLVALLVRELFTVRALAPDRRRRYLVRAVGEPTWTMDEIELWAAHLSKIRRRYRVFLDRPAHALRFRLQAIPQGTRYTIEGSWRLDRIMLNPVLQGLEITRLRTQAGGDQRLWRGPVTRGPGE